MTHGRALALAPGEWYALLGPAPTESLAHLLKVAVEIPAILEKAESLVEKRYPESLTATDLLIRKFYELKEWRAQKASPYWVVPSTLENPADEKYNDKLFPFALKFHSIATAVEWIFCSTIMLRTVDAALTAGSVGLSSPNNGLLVCDLALQGKADKLARLLCQCFEYCFTLNNGTLGAQATCSAQWAVQTYFDHHGRTREIEWCKNISAMGAATHSRLKLMAVGKTDNTQ